MIIKSPYKNRPVRFIELYRYADWQIKIYSISVKSEFVSDDKIQFAKQCLPGWLSNVSNCPFETYKVATLILHEGKEGNFAIISWWVDENMLQLYAYLATNETPDIYELISDKGTVSCVWEMAVLWFERNAWVRHVLEKAHCPDMNAYLMDHLNADV
jgi:hypothetical protein